MQIGNLKLPNPAVMGILNVTPDSFSDGGRFAVRDAAVRHAETMLADGASLIDVGGESTRPGAADVGVQVELDRVIPVIEFLRLRTDVPISIDTSKSAVMREAANAGAGMINDVRALQEPGALIAATELALPVCLMHMQGQPRVMQVKPKYDNVVEEVLRFLADRLASCINAGLDRELIVVDPGFGFGKSHLHNVELLANLRQLTELKRPLLVGWSRKSTLGELTGRDTDSRVAASVAAAVLAVTNGANIVRAHDVADTVDALKIVQAVMEKEQ